MERVYRVQVARGVGLLSGTGNDLGLRHQFHSCAKVAYHYFAASVMNQPTRMINEKGGAYKSISILKEGPVSEDVGRGGS